MQNEFDDTTASIEEWLGRRRPRHEAAKLMGVEPADDRDDETDVALRDLVMKPLTTFDTFVHPAARWADAWHDWFTPTPPKIMRVFGPAGTGAEPDRDVHYTREWTFTEPSFGGSARADRLTGRFSAGHSLTSGYGQALAAVGIVMVPEHPWCTLSIRPYVTYEGSHYLSGRRPEDAWENATSTGWASAGILVESWDVGGGAYFQDTDRWILLSSFSRTNPVREWRDFSGSATTTDGLTVDVFASSSRRYRIWVYCWAEVQAQMLVSAGAYASTSLSCWMPYLVVEQKKL